MEPALESTSSCETLDLFAKRSRTWSIPRTPSVEDKRGGRFGSGPDEDGLSIASLPEHLLLLVFGWLDWDTRFSTLPLVCRAWARLCASPSPELWRHVQVDFAAHIWLRGVRLRAWLAARATGVSSLELRGSDARSAPWLGGWCPGSRMQASLHDLHPCGSGGLARVVEPLCALRTLRLERCDDLLGPGALAAALARLPGLRRLELAVTSPVACDGVVWEDLRELRCLDIRCGLPGAFHDAAATTAARARTAGGGLGLGAGNAPMPTGEDDFLAEESGFPLPLRSLKALTRLSLACAEVTAVPASIAELRDLRSLSLSSRNLCELPAAVGELTSLEELSLNGCGLGEGPAGGLWTLPPELARCPLRRLDLMGCALRCMPLAVAMLPGLEELNLGCNHISWLPENLQSLSQLRSLSLFSNDLRAVPPGIAWLTSLEELFLDANPRLQFGQGAAPLTHLPNLRCLSAMQEGCHSELAFDFWSESSICFLHHLDLALKRRHHGRGYVRLH